MCGRFVSSSPPDEIARYFDAVLSPEVSRLEANYNVAPSTGVYAVVERDHERLLEVFRWGLVPRWAKDPSAGNKMVNARGETAPDKPAFRYAFEKQRCLVPADGFFEWQVVEGQKRKRPLFIHRADGEPLAFAGLWERWKDPTAPDRVLHSCTILTTAANQLIAPIHDRMPVMLPPERWGPWLDPANHDVAELRSFLVPAPEELLAFHEVSIDVNNVRNKGAHLVEPVAPPPAQATLL